ncbi:MAG: DUF937 domain-containing protein, partial [Saprospiraceae bacterium]
MATNLIAQFKSAFGETLVRQCSVQLGESAQSISSSIDTIVPSLLGSIISKGSLDAGALMEFTANDNLSELDLTENVVSQAELDFDTLISKGSIILNYLTGNKLTGIIDVVSSGSGLKTSSASSMLKIIAPLFLGFFRRVVKENSISPAGIKDFLLSQTEFVNESIPPRLHALLVSDRVTPVPDAPLENGEIIIPNPSTGMSKVLPWIILMLASL